MFQVERVTATPSSVKQMQYAYLEHLHLYRTGTEANPSKRQLTDDVSFLDQLERAHLKTPSMKERDFLEKRNTFRTEEELLQRMNYTNCLHYSQLHNVNNT